MSLAHGRLLNETMAGRSPLPLQPAGTGAEAAGLPRTRQDG